MSRKIFEVGRRNDAIERRAESGAADDHFHVLLHVRAEGKSGCVASMPLSTMATPIPRPE